ncbi:unnamed protein product, partial [Symbiodinium sp. CCMP2592]
QAPVPSAELFAESEQLHERAVENLTAALQQGHPLTLASLHNQACSWIDRCFHEEGSLTGKRVDTAVEQLRLVHKLRIEKLGKEHPDTQQTEKKISEISNLQKQMEKDGANHGAMEAFGTWQELLQSVGTRYMRVVVHMASGRKKWLEERHGEGVTLPSRAR